MKTSPPPAPQVEPATEVAAPVTLDDTYDDDADADRVVDEFAKLFPNCRIIGMQNYRDAFFTYHGGVVKIPSVLKVNFTVLNIKLSLPNLSSLWKKYLALYWYWFYMYHMHRSREILKIVKLLRKLNCLLIAWILLK